MNSTWPVQPVTMATSAHNPGSLYMAKTVLERAIQYAVLSLSTVTIIANPITLAALVKSRLVMVSSINVAIASICLSDLLIGLTVFALYFPALDVQVAAKNHSLMKARFGISICCDIAFFASNLNGFLITLDRALASVFPLQYKTRKTVKGAVAAVVTMWLTFIVFVIAVCTVPVLRRGAIHDIQFPNQVLPKVVINYFTAPCIVVSFITNVVLYALIVRTILKSSEKVLAKSKSGSEKRNLRLTRMATAVIGVMLIGNLPVTTLCAIPVPAHTSPYLYTYGIAFDVSVCFGLIPTFVNNIIYAGRMADFKRAIRDLLCCKKASVRGNRPGLVSSSNVTGSTDVNTKPKNNLIET